MKPRIFSSFHSSSMHGMPYMAYMDYSVYQDVSVLTRFDGFRFRVVQSRVQFELKIWKNSILQDENTISERQRFLDFIKLTSQPTSIVALY